MNKKRLVTISLMLLAIMLMVAPIASAQVPSTTNDTNANNGRGSYQHVTGKIIIHDIAVEDVYAYVADLHHDTCWYPGTLTSELVSGDGGKGSVYHEQVGFFGQVFDISATVLHLVPNKHVRFTSDGIFINQTRYDMKQLQDGSTEFIIDSFVLVPEGATYDWNLYLQALTYQLLGCLGGAYGQTYTGELILPAHGNQQS